MKKHTDFIDIVINQKSNFKVGIDRELVNKELTKRKNEYIEEEIKFNHKNNKKLFESRKELEKIAINNINTNESVSGDFAIKLKNYLDDKYSYHPMEKQIMYNRYSKYELIVEIIFIKDDQAMKRKLLKKLKKNNSYLTKIRIGELERELEELNRVLTNIRKPHNSDLITYIIERSREVAK